jgi:hypothetical protein
MDDTPTPENPAKKEFNKLDLSQLQGFSFGTQWSQEKSEPRGTGSGREGFPRREGDRDRRDGPGGGPRDRRGFRRPGLGGGEGGPPADADSRGPREARGPGGADFRGPRRDGPGGERSGEFRGPRFGGGRDSGFRPEDRGPYISPHFAVTFYPEDASFSALAKTIRSSCRTFELFDIARTVIGKPERFVVVLARRSPDAPEGAPPSAAPAAAAEKLAPISVAIPDGLPFENDDAVIAHVLERHLGTFFDVAEVEVDPPKGNFQVINKCGVTGELLGPPNYHRYNQILQQHHASKIKGMSFEAFRSRIESVREPEAVTQWQEKMKKTTRYTWKPATPPAEGTPPTAFDSFEEARLYLVTQARDRMVRQVENLRFHGTVIATLPPGEIRRAAEGALERQRRFPLDTANALRGRLRREGFTIFKKGSKGVSYVCAVKRKFRVPGQTFSESIGSIISYVEAHPMVRASDLPTRLLGIALPAPAADGSAPALDPADVARLNRMQGDLRWLVTEGYVTEFLDGRLFAPPAMVEARKKEIESAEHDPENFPEVPAAERAEAAAKAPLGDAAPRASEAVDPAPIEPEAASESVSSSEPEAPAAEAAPSEPEGQASVQAESEAQASVQAENELQTSGQVAAEVQPAVPAETEVAPAEMVPTAPAAAVETPVAESVSDAAPAAPATDLGEERR